MVLAMKRMIFKEILSSKRTSIAFLVLDRVVRIRNIFPMIKEVPEIHRTPGLLASFWKIENFRKLPEHQEVS